MLLGASDVISVVIRSSLVAILTPDEMRGRVNAVNSLFIGTSNQAGEFESGVTAALLGPVGAVVLGRHRNDPRGGRLLPALPGPGARSTGSTTCCWSKRGLHLNRLADT